MRRSLSSLVFVGFLICAGAVWCCATQASMGATHQRSELEKVLFRAASVVRQRTAVPLRLPTYVADLNEAREGDIYAIVESADSNGYSIILAADPDCEGQHQCSYGTLIGTTRSLKGIDDYDLVHRRGTPVALANSLKGHFYPAVCRAYCSDSVITWSEGQLNYVIGLKAERKANLVKTVNSAIRAGAQGWQ